MEEKVTTTIGNTKVTFDKDELTISNAVTLEDLRNNLINHLNKNIGDIDGYMCEVELLRLILQYEEKTR